MALIPLHVQVRFWKSLITSTTMIPSFNTSRTLFLLCLVFFLSLCSTKVRSQHYCPNTTTYTPGSIYQSNVNYLLSVLSSNSTAINGFYNFTAGHSPPDIAYGLFLCRGDISRDSCRDCVAGITKDIIQLCPNQKTAMVWHSGADCFLRFSNQSMFSIADQSISLEFYNTQNVTEPNRFEKVLGEVMDDVASRASNSRSGKKFATRETKFTPLQTLYGLAQCTPDVSGSDCNTCLRNALSNLANCCGGRQGAVILFPSCTIRYEMYPFYNATATAAAPPPSPAVPPPAAPGPTSSPGDEHEGDVA